MCGCLGVLYSHLELIGQRKWPDLGRPGRRTPELGKERPALCAPSRPADRLV